MTLKLENGGKQATTTRGGIKKSDGMAMRYNRSSYS
jgi:hypothetical protein